MDTHEKRRPLERLVVIGALAFGVAAGGYGIANAASGSSTSGSSALTAVAQPAQPWDGQRRDETLLTGSDAAKVKQLALDKLPGATVIRIETDADGNAAYEAHVVRSDGTPATVYASKAFEVVKVEAGMSGPPPGTGSGG